MENKDKKEEGKTVKRGHMLVIDAALLAVLLAIDQWTKWLAVTKLKGHSAFVLIKGVLELDYLENRGSAFGMLQGQKFFILFVDVIFLAVILFLLIKIPEPQTEVKKYCGVHVLLSMVVAGGVGNMIDRLRLDYVVDFISFVLIHFPIFNVADCYVVVATFSLMFLFLFIFTERDLEFLNFKQNRYREMK